MNISPVGINLNQKNNNSKSFGYKLIYGKTAKHIPREIRNIINVHREAASKIGGNQKVYIGVSSREHDHLDLHLPTGFPIDRNWRAFPWDKPIDPIYQIVRTVSRNMYDDSNIGKNLIEKLKVIFELYNEEAARYAKSTSQDIETIKKMNQPQAWGIYC